MAFLNETGLAEVWSLIDKKFGRLEVGSYKGTGTIGANKPCSLTFSFEPEVIIFVNPGLCKNSQLSIYWENLVFTKKQLTDNSPYSILNYRYVSSGAAWVRSDLLFTLCGKTLTWYTDGADGSPSAQMNTGNKNYYYIAIG